MSISNIASEGGKCGMTACWEPHHRPPGDGDDPTAPRLPIPEYLRYSVVLASPPWNRGMVGETGFEPVASCL